jgi:hypothetical protein
MIWRRAYRMAMRYELVLLIPAVAVLILVSSQTGFNRYLRYVLPAVPFFYIFASRAGKAFETKERVIQVLCIACVVLGVASSLVVYPHSMSYFNEAAGGPKGGPKHLLDANIDWGQDLLELKKYVDQHPEVSPIGLAYFGYADPKLTGLSFRAAPAGPGFEDWSETGPKPGWYAVSVNHLYGYRHYDSDKPRYTYFQNFKPVATIGYSIYIFHITIEDANGKRVGNASAASRMLRTRRELVPGSGRPGGIP